MEKNQIQPIDINGNHFKRAGFVLVLMAGTFLTIINQTLLVTALPKIMSDLDINAIDAQWLITSFMLISGIMIPTSAFLLNTITNRTLFFVAMGSFAVGTVICALSTTYNTLLLGRIIQAIGSGLMIPLMQTLMFLVYPAERRGEAMGLVGIVIAFSPAIAPTVSGWIVDYYDWRYLFYILLPIVGVNILLAFFYMKNIINLTKPKLDFFSLLLSSLGLGSLLYGINVAGNVGWQNEITWISCIIGIVVIIIFSRRQLKITQPFLELRVFKSRTFTLSTIIVAIIFMTMIGSEILLPIYTQSIKEYSALQSGLILLPGALVLGVISPIAGKLFDKYGIKKIAMIGMLILTIASFPFLWLTKETAIWWIVCLYSLRMLGMGLVMMPLATAGINALPNELISHGSAINNTVRQVFASLGAAIMVGVMSATITRYSNDYEGISLPSLLKGLNNGFMSAFILIVIAFILCFLLKSPIYIKKEE
ncbi:DHA2 family efflux MFS transporter permease subunit [Siminovitchia terrae]|uniref:DHA2 family efflux MFS transporter permease subunit n=1 Tax=Siminovitchia terrae TaxID=1914933 RepID=A0A429X5B9_SIMTE|nr:MDR family MFS transporter [Siminovitchia terrae]RST58625.1 DHA2 family efflux MFS transporter permease subunit [Siminovitchia terrae]